VNNLASTDEAKILCCIFNYAPHYRIALFRKFERAIPCHFYFGDNPGYKLKKLDLRDLESNTNVHNSIFITKNFYWISGTLSLLFKKYRKYLITGEIRCLSSWFILITARLSGKQIYLWSHGYYGTEKGIKALIKKFYFLLARGTFLYNNYSKKLMIEKGLNADNLFIVYNSLDYEQLLTVRNRIKKTNLYIEKFGNSFPVLVFIGRLEKGKKLSLLIEAMDIIRKETPLNLIIIGDGEEREDLWKQVLTKGLESSVWFTGALYEELKIGEFISNADICISPGNVGLTAVHSLSYGTPVITHNNLLHQMPEFEIITAKVNGEFFVEGDPASLANVIQAWLTAHPSKTKELIETCYKKVDEFYNPDYQVGIFKKHLLQV
jgi:glycosyltransferase involved in cell wall biosynthesis